MEYMVSVIMPTYNHERYIRQALDSVLMQVIPFSMEILIGDDCSTDGTLSIVNEYKTKYPDIIRVFAHPENIGATRNAYELLTHAQGKYLATLEGDDFWTDPYKLQKQIDFLESSPQYIGCTHFFSIVDEEGRLLRNQKLSWVRQKKTFSLKDFDGIIMPGQPSTFVRRNIFRNPEHDYSICYKAHEMIADRTLMLIFLCQGPFYCMGETMGAYRRPRNASAQNITNQIYRRNRLRLVDDFNHLNYLERYAEKELNAEVHFESRKYQLFFDALIVCMLHPNQFNGKVMIYILKNLYHPVYGILLLPKYLVLKIITYIKYHFYK